MDQNSVLYVIGAWLLAVLVKSFMNRVDGERKKEVEVKLEKIESQLRLKLEISDFRDRKQELEKKIEAIDEARKELKEELDKWLEDVEKDLGKKIDQAHKNEKEVDIVLAKFKTAIILHIHDEKGRVNTGEVIL